MMVVRRRRPDGAFPIAGRLGVCVGVEGGLRERGAAGPEPTAAALVRVGLLHHVVGAVWRAAGVERRAPPREAGTRQVKAPPEEVHRARLAQESPPKSLEDA